MSIQRLPQPDSIRELAQFWDTHDLTDFDEMLEEADGPTFERTRAVTLRLGHDEAEAVHRIAEAEGMADADLIRRWVLERIVHF